MSEYRYIMIMEDGTLYKSPEITDDEKIACRDGYISIIDVSIMKEYHESIDSEEKWVDLKSWSGEN